MLHDLHFSLFELRTLHSKDLATPLSRGSAPYLNETVYQYTVVAGSLDKLTTDRRTLTEVCFQSTVRRHSPSSPNSVCF